MIERNVSKFAAATIVALVVAGCTRSGAPAESAGTPAPKPEVVPALATSMHAPAPETVPPPAAVPAAVPAEGESMGDAAKALDERAAKLGEVVNNVDELVASALELQKALLLIYAEEQEEELEKAEAQVQQDTKAESAGDESNSDTAETEDPEAADE